MIEIKNLTKKYGNFTALNQLNLQIDAGIVFGFVGANGAGKSTTFSILSTLLAPTSGEAYVNGMNVIEKPEEVRKYLGYMPDFFGVYDQLKVEEYLEFYGASYGLTAEQRKKLIPELLELVNLTDKRTSYVDLLSRGMKQRLCLARTLIHDPKVLILDEPASGLDPRARTEMRDILKHLKSMGKTILISSHILPELAEMCDEIGVLERGQLIAKGNVLSIQQQLMSEKEIILKIEGDLRDAVQFFEEQSHVSAVEASEKEHKISFFYKGSRDEQIDMLKKAYNANLKIYSAIEVEKDLEDVFLAITKGAELDATKAI